MEQSALSILLDEKRVNDLLQQKTGAKAFAMSICNVLFFIFFLSLYTALALSEPFLNSRTFESYLRRRFDTEAAVRLNDVESINSFWQYTNKSFVPGIYSENTEKYFYPGYEIERFLSMGSSSRLLGAGVRLRMIKISANKDCKINPLYSSKFKNCYGPYRSNQLDTTAYGPISQQGGRTFIYSPKKQGDIDYIGKVTTYKPGGFDEALTSSFNTSITKLRVLEQNDWLGPGLRAIFYDWTVYNFNLGLYGVCSIAFEIAPSGQWVNTFKITILQQRNINPLGDSSNTDLIWLACEGLLVVCVIRYLLEEMSEFLGCEKRSSDSNIRVPTIKFEYFLDSWNVLDLANLFLIIIVLVSKFETWQLAQGKTIFKGPPEDADAATFTDYSGVAQNVRTIRSLVAFNSVLIWIKAVKYITVIPYITTFMQLVRSAQTSLIAFMTVFLTSSYGFTLAFSTAFGEQFHEFRSPWMAACFILRSFFGDADINLIYESSPVIGSIMILLFVSLIFFILMNLFKSVMIAALSDAKLEMDGQQSKDWNDFLKRASEFFDTISVSFRLEQRFRTSVPGLYSRLMTRKKKLEDQEKLRDEYSKQKEKSKQAVEGENTGGLQTGLGRRPKKVIGSSSAENDDDSEDQGSEPDLGPLFKQEQLTTVEDTGHERGGSPKALEFGETAKEEILPNLDAKAMDRVIKATTHVVKGINEHTQIACGNLSKDMDESKEVMMALGNVLDVLARRAKSLEAQQTEVLRHHRAL